MSEKHSVTLNNIQFITTHILHDFVKHNPLFIGNMSHMRQNDTTTLQ